MCVKLKLLDKRSMCITPTQPTTKPINPYISRHSHKHTISSDNRNNWLMCVDKWITYFLGNSLEDEVKQNSITPLLTHTHTHTASTHPQTGRRAESCLSHRSPWKTGWSGENKNHEKQSTSPLNLSWDRTTQTPNPCSEEPEETPFIHLLLWPSEQDSNPRP